MSEKTTDKSTDYVAGAMVRGKKALLDAYIALGCDVCVNIFGTQFAGQLSCLSTSPDEDLGFFYELTSTVPDERGEPSVAHFRFFAGDLCWVSPLSEQEKKKRQSQSLVPAGALSEQELAALLGETPRGAPGG
jgi:hypothetical protein